MTRLAEIGRESVQEPKLGEPYQLERHRIVRKCRRVGLRKVLEPEGAHGCPQTKPCPRRSEAHRAAHCERSAGAYARSPQRVEHCKASGAKPIPFRPGASQRPYGRLTQGEGPPDQGCGAARFRPSARPEMVSCPADSHPRGARRNSPRGRQPEAKSERFAARRTPGRRPGSRPGRIFVLAYRGAAVASATLRRCDVNSLSVVRQCRG